MDLLLADLCKNRYFIIGNLAEDEEEVVRIAGLLRGTESAAQAVSVSHHLSSHIGSSQYTINAYICMY